MSEHNCRHCGRPIGYFPLKDGNGNDADPPKCPYKR